jgi:hypothetical protein
MQVLHARRTVLLIQVNDYLGVTLGSEAVSRSPQILAEVLKVVDLAIEYDCD